MFTIGKIKSVLSKFVCYVINELFSLLDKGKVMGKRNDNWHENEFHAPTYPYFPSRTLLILWLFNISCLIKIHWCNTSLHLWILVLNFFVLYSGVQLDITPGSCFAGWYFSGWIFAVLGSRKVSHNFSGWRSMLYIYLSVPFLEIVCCLK